MIRDRTELHLDIAGRGLTTAQIYYHMPDFHDILQSYVWQEFDCAPTFPKLHEFLNFWEENLDGLLHSVEFCHKCLLRPGEWRAVEGEFRLH